MMNITREEKKVEAIERMKLLGIFPETIKQFEQDGYVSISEPPIGAFFGAKADDLQRIQDFEAEYNALVYLVIRSHTTIGKMDSYLYVGDHREEWRDDRDGLKSGEVYCYVYNHDMPDYSEIEMIGISKTCAAGLCRTW